MSALVATRTSSSQPRTLPLLLTTREVAEALRVDARTVERWAAAGRLHRIRLTPKTIRFRADDVAALIAHNDQEPAVNGLLGKAADSDRQLQV